MNHAKTDIMENRTLKPNTIRIENCSDHPESRFFKIFLNFSSPTADFEIKRRVALLAALSVIGIITLFGFGIAAFTAGNKPLFIIDTVSAIILSLNLIDAKLRKKYDFNIFVGVSLVSFTYLTLYAFGGEKNTAFVWYFTYPLIACYLLGSKRGGTASLLMTLPVLFLMIANKNSSIFANYNYDLEIRFLFSYLVIASFSYLFEKTRETNHEALKHVNQSLEKEVEKRTSELNLSNKNLIREIEERKQAEEAMRESEEKLVRSKKMESLGLLAGGVSHDLNNVLSGIVSYPELILMDLPKDSKLRKPIETIQESGHRAAAIVQDLLTVARGVATTKEPLNLNDIIGD